MLRTVRRKRTGRRGYFLMASVILVVAFLVLGTGMLTMAGTGRRLANRRWISTQALNLALGAQDDAIMQLKNSSGYAGYTNRALGPGTASVSVTIPSGQPGRRTVTCSGTVTSGDVTITRRVLATVDLPIIPLIFKKVIGSRKDLSFNGSTTLNSTPTTGLADVQSNGQLTVGSSALTIDGKAMATGTVTLQGGAHPTVSGGMVSGAPPVAFPTVDQAFINQSLDNGITTPPGGTLTVNNGSLVQGKINGNLTVGNPNGCQITGVVWVTGNMSISGPITGKGTIVCNGTISLNATMSYPTASVAKVVLISTSTSDTAIDMGGNRQFKGTVYAPYGGINYHGSGSFSVLGSLLADRLTFSGNVTVTRDTSLDGDPPPVPTNFDVKGWQEL